MAEVGIWICLIVGVGWGIADMKHARKYPTFFKEEPRDPNQTGNSRTRRGAFDLFK